jgi:hypothetical protein
LAEPLDLALEILALEAADERAFLHAAALVHRSLDQSPRDLEAQVGPGSMVPEVARTLLGLRCHQRARRRRQ